MLAKKNPELGSYIFEFVEDYRERYGLAPSLGKIESELGIPKATASRYLKDLSAAGYVLYEEGKIKSVRGNRETTVRVPKLGRISCGPLKLACEQYDEYVRLPVALFGTGDLFILEADGDSMIDIGIEPGDYVVCRKQCVVENGEVAVVLVEDEATLKRFYREDGRFRLHPENVMLDDIYVDNCRIIGKAIHTIKAIH